MLSGIVLAALASTGAPTGAPAAPPAWSPARAPLMTRWSRDVRPDAALPEYPRPTMRRREWLNLNGLWDYAWGEDAAAPASFGAKILVPYPVESALSGVRDKSRPEARLWYRRTVEIPAGWRGRRVLLHFGAVNWDAVVRVNGREIGRHRGGYDPFSFEITQALRPGANEIVVGARNPLLSGNEAAQPVGKQSRESGGIFYTAATGIWQTVWMEPVAPAHIRSLRITPDLDAGLVRVRIDAEGGARRRFEVEAPGHGLVSKANGSGDEILLPMPKARPWSPEAPTLYDLRVRMLDGDRAVDAVDSYVAMRKSSLGKDAQGRTTMLLNGRSVFQVGVLDQGYWPDGIYTAPTDAALRSDIEAAKRLGFNMIRKHAKVEPERWYYWADRLGVLVWQDMPQAFGEGRRGVEGGYISDAGKAQFDLEWSRIMTARHNHPSIVVWTPFNEGWGQHDTARIAAETKAADPSRLVNAASGWFDKHVGDIADVHAYPGPGAGDPEPNRAAVNGEFGGVTRSFPGHVWTSDVYGYGATLDDEWTTTYRYQRLLRAAYGLRESKATSAIVYTQLTDVEQEINGLLTYDRARFKADPRIVAAANRGRFLALPPNPNPPIVPPSDLYAQTWRYTLEAPPADWTSPNFADAGWRSGPAPFGHDLERMRTNWNTPQIWIRREATLPAKLPERLAFSVFHDEDVEIYVNGVLAASAEGYTTGYVTLPMNAAGRAALRPGRNVIAVHCRQTRGGQGIDVGIVRASALRR